MTLVIRSFIKNFKKKLKDKTGAAIIEYGMLVAGVGLVAAAAVSVLGHKTADLVATSAAVLPGAHADDNNPIAAPKLFETSVNDGAIGLDIQGIVDNANTARLETNLGFAAGTLENLVTEVGEEATP